MAIFKNKSLIFKMTIITIAVGIATWGLLDPMQRRTMRNTFGTELTARLEQEAYENRMLFDGYVNRFIQSAKILVSQRHLYDYVRANREGWSSAKAGADRIKYNDDPPAWLPSSSVIRTLPNIHYIFLLDNNNSIREAYKKYPEMPPAELLEPTDLLLQLSHQQAFMTEIADAPYLVASEALLDARGNVMATLLVAGLLDNEFIGESQGARYSKKLVALISTERPVILSSSYPDILPPGLELESLEDRYIYSGSGFFDYGSADLHIKFVTFLPKRPYEMLSEAILKQERRNSIVTAAMLILSFVVVMFWITKRIQNVTRKVRKFAEVKMQTTKPHLPRGDEIDVLEGRLRLLSEEIVASHDAIREQAWSLRQERDRAQNYLDIAASIFLVLDSRQNVVILNKKGCGILGFKEGEINGRNWFDTVLPSRCSEQEKSYFISLIASDIDLVVYQESPVLTTNGEERTIGWHNSLLKDEAGRITGLLRSGEDITERKVTEEALVEAHGKLEIKIRERTAELENTNMLLKQENAERRTAEEKLREAVKTAENEKAKLDAIIMGIGDGIIIQDTNYRVIYENQLQKDQYGDHVGELCHKAFEGIDTVCEGCPVKLSFEDEKVHKVERSVSVNGTTQHLELTSSPLKNGAGKIIAGIKVVRDITASKETEAAIIRSLKEKEVLLQEVHHRVKNNMAVISSLLKLQADKVTDKHYREIFNDSMGRIQTMALIHEKLYRSEDLDEINFGDYLRDMIDNTFITYGLSPDRIALKKDVDSVTLGIDMAIPCGLIINELISNSLKYAFPEGRSGEVRVALRPIGDGEVKLTVGDNGVGMPEGLDFRNADTLGLNLVSTLTRQLKGHIELHGEEGTEFQITFRSRR